MGRDNEKQIHLKVSPYLNIIALGLCGISLLADKVTLKSLLTLPLAKCRRYFEFNTIFSVNRTSLSVDTTEGSASVELSTEGSAESLTEGTFGRSLHIILFKVSCQVMSPKLCNSNDSYHLRGLVQLKIDSLIQTMYAYK